MLTGPVELLPTLSTHRPCPTTPRRAASQTRPPRPRQRAPTPPRKTGERTVALAIRNTASFEQILTSLSALMILLTLEMGIALTPASTVVGGMLLVAEVRAFLVAGSDMLGGW